jgi:succinate dehydrogenase / fumarate reductase, iron-sulfur subunit
MKLTLKIFRLNPEKDMQPHYDTFQVEAEPNQRILDCLNKVRWTMDSSLSLRMSCGHGICGSDGLTINGHPTLACQKLVGDFGEGEELLIEPLKYYPVIKDLIVDMKPFYRRIKAVNPKNPVNLSSDGEKEQKQTVKERSQFDDAIKCVLCGCCLAACPVLLEQDQKFLGPAAVLRAQRYIFDSRITDKAERMQVLEVHHGVWGCKSYYMCTVVCPKKIKVTQAILSTKKAIIEHHQQTMKEIAKKDGDQKRN